MTHLSDHHYADGPTTCAPTPQVLRSVRQEIRASNAVSRADIRLATAMGLISANSLRPLGFNDGVFYPVEELVARAAPRAAPTEIISLAPLPQKRTLHALALMVDFADNPGLRPKADFQSLLFDAANPNSMTSYYRELSNGQIEVTGEVTDYLRMPQPYTFYTAGQSGMDSRYPQNTPGLLFDALTVFCQSDSLQRFDVDRDGFVDGIFLIHAGGGAEAEPDPTRRPHKIWSHKWVLPTPFVDHGVKVYAYSTEPEDGRLGVFAHEFGHVLGLPDLYDSTYRSRGAGQWCLMAGGSWGGNGDQPVRLSAWCLERLGWVTPKIVRRAGIKRLQPLAQDKRDCYRLRSKGKRGPEYFLIENRQRAGRDIALPGSGLAVWHIDETQAANTNPLCYMVGPVQADGKRDLELNRNDGDAGDLFPGARSVTAWNDHTTPPAHAHDGTPTGVALSQISESSGVIRLRVKV